MKKKIVVVICFTLILVLVLFLFNTYKEKAVNDIMGGKFDSITKIELIENESITKITTDEKMIDIILKNLGETKVKKRLEQPSLIPYSTYMMFYNNDKQILMMDFDKDLGYIDILFTQYHLISNGMSLDEFKNIIK